MARIVRTATVTADHALEYRCSACDFESRAVVRAVGKAEADLWPGSKVRVAEGARADAAANAQRTLSLSTCPACEKRDRRAVKAQKERAIAWALVMLLVLSVTSLVLTQREAALQEYWFIFVVVTLVVPFMTWSQGVNVIQHADERVRFLGVEAATREAAGGAEPQTRKDERTDRRSTKQIAGRPCTVCNKKLIAAFDGGACDACGDVTHASCAKKHAEEHHPGPIPYR